MKSLKLIRLSESNRTFVSVMNQRLQSKALSSSIAMAKVISDTLPPSEGVSPQDIGDHFENMLKVPVLDILSAINELFPIEYDIVENYTKKFYSIRHWLGNKTPTDIYIVGEVEPVLSFFGVAQFLDPATLEAIRTDRVSITVVMNGMSKLLAECDDVGI